MACPEGLEPPTVARAFRHIIKKKTEALACPEGLEPPTVGLENRCSIQLSYGQTVRVISNLLPLGQSVRLQ